MNKVYYFEKEGLYNILTEMDGKYKISHENISKEECSDILKKYTDIPKEEIEVELFNKEQMKCRIDIYIILVLIAISLIVCVTCYFVNPLFIADYSLLLAVIGIVLLIFVSSEATKEKIKQHEDLHIFILDKYGIEYDVSIRFGKGIALPITIMSKQHCLEALIYPTETAKNDKTTNILTRFVRTYVAGFSDIITYNKISKIKNCFAVEYNNNNIIYLYKHKM